MKNQNLKLTTLIASVLFSFSALAEIQQLSALEKAEASIPTAQVQQVITLKKPNEKSQTRINLLVKDLGGSTDLSPHMGMYLTFWQDGEMGDSTASFDLGRSYQIVDIKNNNNGTLEIISKQLIDGNHLENVKLTVNYKNFAAKFEKEASVIVNEFETNWIKGDIFVTSPNSRED